MTRLIFSVLTVAVLAGCAVPAQGPGHAGVPTYGPGIPAAVAPVRAPGSVYTDRDGRRVYMDQSGRQYLLDHNGTYIDEASRRIRVGPNGELQVVEQVQGIRPAIYDAEGRVVYLDAQRSYVDRFGNRMLVDTSGRHVRLDQHGTTRDAAGRILYLGPNGQPQYVEHNGQLMPYSGVAAPVGRPGDRDGDGVPDAADRFPNDPRYR